MENQLGSISAIYRYPVKSFRGEKLQEAQVFRFGLYGDRSHAFIDEKSPVRHLTAKHVPQLIEYQPVCTSSGDETTFPDIQVMTPEGRVYAWGDERLRRVRPFRLQKRTGSDGECASAARKWKSTRSANDAAW
ncbi:MOSC N-terminal beta barrel domain-containing protein [Brevibacillus massiliensis]|uniref:MOSC N-terminal beta barrel domain-containing protein n=1 Tax=Brevibacillus massiliensis TaxID=1118054 RepID=UPI00031F887B|nr:MOSC N-terminal beta barrel domain-containing protein [Brevibacillus massiliensis]